jgi:hypothetical protein
VIEKKDRIPVSFIILFKCFFLFSRVSSNMSPNSQLEHEKRVRREIANSNERRRMQSINTGFQSLKILIPHSCGEKLSKVSYVYFITRYSKKRLDEKDEEMKGKNQGHMTESSKICRINKSFIS